MGYLVSLGTSSLPALLFFGRFYLRMFCHLFSNFSHLACLGK